MRPALYVPAVDAVDWLSNELLARQDLTAVWLKEVRAQTELKSGVPTAAPSHKTRRTQ